MAFTLTEQIIRMKVLSGVILSENIQRADKVYFLTNKLPDVVRDNILRITGGDNYTYLITELYYYLTLHDEDKTKWMDNILSKCNDFHKLLKDYNKDLFPHNIDLNKVTNIFDLFQCLEWRYYLIKQWDNLPSIARRNLTGELNHVYTHQYEYKDIFEKLKILNLYITNIPEQKKEQIYSKIFTSKSSFDTILKNAETISNGFNNMAEDFDKESLLNSLKEYDDDIIQNDGDIIVVKINDYETMTRLGCTTLWCFARMDSENYWQEYAPFGYVYIIYDFSKEYFDSTFIMVYLPGMGGLYMGNNEPYEDHYDNDDQEYLKSIGVNIDLLN